MKKRLLSIVLGSIVAIVLLIIVPVKAQVLTAPTSATPPPTQVVGVVKSVNSTTIMLTSSRGILFSVDVKNQPTIVRGGYAIQLSDIVVGETIIVQGSINATSAIANSILDGGIVNKESSRPPGTIQLSPGGVGASSSTEIASSTTSTQFVATTTPSQSSPVNGTVEGSVVNINTAGLTVDAGTQLYSVDASKSIFSKNNAVISLSLIAIGDHVVVQGIINGTSVTATSITDEIISSPLASTSQSGAGAATVSTNISWWQRIKNFFTHVFSW